MEVPPNLFPEENEEKAVWFRRRLAHLKQKRNRYLSFACLVFFMSCFLALLLTLSLTRMPLLLYTPAVLICGFGIVQSSEVLQRGKIHSRVEAHWRQAFSENYVLPLSLLIEGVKTLPLELNIEAQKRMIIALTTPQIAEYDTLTFEEKHFLIRELRNGKRGRQLLLLYIAEHYGGAETLSTVESFVKHGDVCTMHNGLPLYDPKVVETAKRILPPLRDRLDPLRPQRVLLRPSEAPPLLETLLRAVYDASPEDETLLLRATSDSQKTED